MNAATTAALEQIESVLGPEGKEAIRLGLSVVESMTYDPEAERFNVEETAELVINMSPTDARLAVFGLGLIVQSLAMHMRSET